MYISVYIEIKTMKKDLEINMKETETKTQIKTQSKGVRILKAVLNTIINILIVVVLIVSLLVAVMALSSKKTGISTVFGYTVQPIQSDSMKGGSPDGYEGGDFEKGDLMIAKATDFDSAAVYEKGDIVTFQSKDLQGNVALVCHRIVDVATAPDGSAVYQTWGDNREVSEVPDQLHEEDYLPAKEIGSVYYSAKEHGFILKGWGKVIDFLKTQTGFFFAVLLPMIIFFMYALVRVVLSATNYRKAKAIDDKDEAVKAAVAEALASQNNSGDDTSAAASDGVSVGMSAEELEQFRQFQEFQKMQKAQKEAEENQPESSSEE